MLEAQIIQANQALMNIASKVKDDQFSPPKLLPGVEDFLREQTVHLNTVTSAAFWNHYIGGVVGIASLEADRARVKGLDPVGVELIRAGQARIAPLVRRWQGKPKREFDPLELQSCGALIAVSEAFDWSLNPTLVLEIAQHTRTLGGAYAGMAGEELI